MALGAEAFADVLRRKWLGNEHFKDGDLDSALSHWDEAIKLFGPAAGDATQAAVQATLHANRAEVFLRLERHAEAKTACDRALQLDDTNFKARFRRARACLALGGFEELAQAADDVKRIQADGGTLQKAEATLLRTAQGMPLLASLAGKGNASAFAKASIPATAFSAEEAAAVDAEARERAAQTVAALAPEMAAAMANAGATGHRPPPMAAPDGAPPRPPEPRLGDLQPVDRTDWMEMLDDRPELRPAWLVDVYRTSFNAEATCARPPERPRHCAGGARASRLSIISDFLLFCKLSVARGVVPAADAQAAIRPLRARRWEWTALLQAAAGMLDKGFHPEKCGAVHRYGEDAGDGAEIRRLATVIYEAGVPGGDSLADRMRDGIKLACWGDDEYDDEGNVRHRFSFDREPELFDDVGGVDLWKQLNEELKKGRLGGGSTAR
jgi:hypothetical protein